MADEIIDVNPGYPWRGEFDWTEEDGTTLDITDHTVTARVEWCDGSFELSVGNGGIVVVNLDPAAFNVLLTRSQTKKLPSDDNATFEIIITDVDGYPVAQGFSKMRRKAT